MKLGLHRGVPNNFYHAQLSPEEHFYSSSQLKDILDDPETFKKKYITKELESNLSIPAFDIGTYFHTAILEPHLLEKECAIFRGKARRGKIWEDFKAENEGKAIITEKEYELAKNLIIATENSEIAMDLHKGGEAEVSLGIELYTDSKDLFVLTKSKSVYVLDVKEGWILFSNAPTMLKDCTKVRLKVRCDYINAKKGYIADLKSTTGNAKDVHKTRNKISSYQYDLSAAMYVDLFNARFISEEKPHKLSTFWWVFSSKDYSNCQCYWTGIGPSGEIDKSNLLVGRAKWRKAVLEIGKYQRLGWEIPEEAKPLSAQPWEMEWIDKGKSENTTKFGNNKTKVKQLEPSGVDLL
jgi:hypothetical protein